MAGEHRQPTAASALQSQYAGAPRVSETQFSMSQQFLPCPCPESVYPCSPVCRGAPLEPPRGEFLGFTFASRVTGVPPFAEAYHKLEFNSVIHMLEESPAEGFLYCMSISRGIHIVPLFAVVSQDQTL